MRVLPLLFVLCIWPLAAHSHPGKTDRSGGHKCYRGCEDWGLLYAEYHFHEKDGKPVRASRTNKARKAMVMDEQGDGPERDGHGAASPAAEEPALTGSARDRFVPGPLCALDSRLLITLLSLLVLLLLVRRRNRKAE